MSNGDTSVKPTGHAGGATPSLLNPIERAPARARLGIAGVLPFRGEDLWTGYEFSWLNESGKPLVAGLRLRVPCASPNLVESKSMKLYLNSFAQARFGCRDDVLEALGKDLAAAFGVRLTVEVLDLDGLRDMARMPGNSLDELEVTICEYERNPGLLKLSQGPEAGQGGVDDRRVTATWHSDLFRALCPITGQPDWASMMVAYKGLPIDPGGLLRYLVSFRGHAAFHEDTVERIFVDIMRRCEPEKLTVYGRFLRRGGLDINPIRSTHSEAAPALRLPRQ